MMEPANFLTSNYAAKLIGVSPSTIIGWERKGLLPAERTVAVVRSVWFFLDPCEDLLTDDLDHNPIQVAGHCYGCTAGQGSSCGGALKEAAE